MRVIAFDTETCLIRPGVTAPEMACLSWAERVGGVIRSGIVRWDQAEPLVRSWLEDDDVLLVGAHTAFDACVLGANFPRLVDPIFRAYRKDRVTCVQYRDRMLDIAAGRFQGYHTKTGGWIKPTYDLDALSARYRGTRLNKPQFNDDGEQINDSFRLRYGEMIWVPIEEWPEEATRYAIEDAVATLEVWEKQEVHAPEYLGEQYNQARKAFALQLMATWGLRTSAEGVIALANKATAERERMRAGLEEDGLVRANGKRNTKAARAYMVQVCKELKIDVPLTDTGCNPDKVEGLTGDEIELKYASLAEDACILTGDPVMKEYAAFGRWGSVLSKDVKALAKGTLYPIHTRPGMAATTRTTTSNPNVQNWGTGWGPRECFVARPGCVYIQADYPQLELRTLAQACIDMGFGSELAKVLNAGKDPHTQVAAVILGCTYDEAKKRLENKGDTAAKNARQGGKIANFGFPGGMGAKALVKNAKKAHDVTLTIDEAYQLKEQWTSTYPEMEPYFEYMAGLCDNPSGLGEIRIPRSQQVRGGAMFCALCNTPFQGLGAVCSGRALWLLAEACYVDRKSVLFGTRNVCHVHDENIGECPDDDLVHERALEWARLMDVGANEYLVDVPMKTDPQAMRFWSKEAFDLRDGRGRIIAWDGHFKCAECGDIFEPPHRKGVKKCSAHTDAVKYVA